MARIAYCRAALAGRRGRAVTQCGAPRQFPDSASRCESPPRGQGTIKDRFSCYATSGGHQDVSISVTFSGRFEERREYWVPHRSASLPEVVVGIRRPAPRPRDSRRSHTSGVAHALSLDPTPWAESTSVAHRPAAVAPDRTRLAPDPLGSGSKANGSRVLRTLHRLESRSVRVDADRGRRRSAS